MNKLPKHILEALKQNKTSLGQHPSYPPDEEDKPLRKVANDDDDAEP